jgi:fatty acid desaturase
MHAWIKDRQKCTIMVSTCVLYAVTISLALTYRQARFAPWLVVPLSLLHLYFYGIIHELTHNNIFARAKTNVLVGNLLCPLNFVYFHTFKTVHLQHHRFTQVPELDPVCTLNKRGEPFNPLWYLVIWPYYAVRWYIRHISQHRDRRRLLAKYAAFTAGLYTVVGLGFWGAAHHAALLDPACLYWHGVLDRYSQPD